VFSGGKVAFRESFTGDRVYTPRSKMATVMDTFGIYTPREPVMCVWDGDLIRWYRL